MRRSFGDFEKNTVGGFGMYKSDFHVVGTRTSNLVNHLYPRLQIAFDDRIYIVDLDANMVNAWSVLQEVFRDR